tara:strand:- start:59 stop:940 length:882 start_codon:yes stop_codon:yes gene_type:complete
MIKLFWNTHNLQKSDYIKNSDKSARDYKWGIYHKKNSDKWIYEILKKVKYKIIEKETDLEKGDIVIIIDSSIEEKIKLYERLKLICSKIFLLHLGDESGIYDFSSVYNNCNFIWRPYCSNRFFKNNKVQCIPIGYKSGVINQNNTRKYKWSFVGTPHKTSRHDLLFQFSDIKPSFCHKTQKFDQKIISVSEMSDVLSSTQFMPCPNGFVHPETYRLYEALECGCIPIVENAYKYYDRLFPKNPFIKVDKWVEAKSILNNWSNKKINEKSDECVTWWSEYKNNLRNSIYRKIIT